MAAYFQCPGCGALMRDQEDAVVLVCDHCGSTLTKYIPEKKINVQIKDVGKGITEVVQEKQTTKRRAIDAADEKDKRDNRLIVILFALCLLGAFLPGISSRIDEQKSAKLTKLVQEIEEDMENGRYDTALTKANRLRWDGDDDDYQAKWNEEREELIKLIKERMERDANH